MQYMGGKSKIRREVAKVIASFREPHQVYYEPFVGAGWILQEVSGIRVASDVNKALIRMYQELQMGWLPPEDVSEDMYKQYKANQDENDPLTAFIGFACSFGGKWFGGYARQKGYNFASGGRRSLIKQLPKINDVVFLHRDYREQTPQGCIIYCDPPYHNTTEYKMKFDSNEFWENMRLWSKQNTVIISEYSAPEDFVCIKEIPTKTIMRDTMNRPLQSVEKLFMYKEHK